MEARGPGLGAACGLEAEGRGGIGGGVERGVDGAKHVIVGGDAGRATASVVPGLRSRSR